MATQLPLSVRSGAIKEADEKGGRRPEWTKEIRQGLSGDAGRRDTPGIVSQKGLHPEGVRGFAGDGLRTFEYSNSPSVTEKL